VDRTLRTGVVDFVLTPVTTKTILLRDMTVCSSLLFAVFRSKSKYALSHSLGNVSECSDMSKGIEHFVPVL
jgi:hypothetical protein